ncbi:MAG: nucleotidyl transferase AbiEii/AbiGii toxin family protein [Nitrospira sp.]|nr:nucleotidyl transferase AbiEii/AbiGii toxin family protein [Nitrospira sp.]
MDAPKSLPIRHHLDMRFFADAIAFTAARQDFVPALIEKDYFCSLVLAYFSSGVTSGLVFKGGTCLTKVHAGFYRLSEDLDFTVPMPSHARRAERSRKMEPVKRMFDNLVDALPEFRKAEPLRGANDSTQYIGSFSYESMIHRNRETIKIEISLREPLLYAAVPQGAATILMNPLSGQPLIPAVQIACINKREALAEKFRAAMTRREPAIRDYFDIDYAVGNGVIDPTEGPWMQMVERKIMVPGNEPIDVSEERLNALKKQLEPGLKTVLRAKEFEAFDLDRAFSIVSKVASALRAIRT